MKVIENGQNLKNSNFFFHFLPVNLPIAFCFCSNLVQWTSPWVEHILQVSSSYIQGFLSNHVFQNLKSEIFLWKTVQKCQKRLKTPKTKLVFSLFAISIFFSKIFQIFKYFIIIYSLIKISWKCNLQGHKKLLLLALGP